MDNFAFLLPITMTLFSVAFFVLGFMTKSVAARAWGAAFLLGAIGFLAPILPLPVKLQSLFGNAVFLVSFYCYAEALLRHFQAPLFHGPRVVFGMVAYAAIIVVVEGLESLHLELLIADLAVATSLGVPLAMVFWRARSLADRLLVIVAAVVVLDIVVRLFVFNVLVGVSNDLADFAASSYTYFMQVAVSVLSVTFALSALGSVLSQTLEFYRHAAERDHLTGLLNRRGFDVATEKLTPTERGKAVVMVCDIDHFKSVNDSFGHAAGDQVLAGLADLLRARLPEGSIVARFGGEEFVVLVQHLPLAASAALAQSIRGEFSARDWRLAGVGQQITLCIGLAAANPLDASPHQTLTRADRALYLAKSGGRNQVMVDAGEAYSAPLRVVSSDRATGARN